MVVQGLLLFHCEMGQDTKRSTRALELALSELVDTIGIAAMSPTDRDAIMAKYLVVLFLIRRVLDDQREKG